MYVCMYVCMYGIVPWLCSWKHHEWYHILFYSADSLSLRGSLHLELACHTTKGIFFFVVASHMCNKKNTVRTKRFNYLRPCVLILNEIIFVCVGPLEISDHSSSPEIYYILLCWCSDHEVTTFWGMQHFISIKGRASWSGCNSFRIKILLYLL